MMSIPPGEGKLTLDFGPGRALTLDHLHEAQVDVHDDLEPVEGSEWQYPQFVQETTTITVKVKGPMRAATEAEMAERGYARTTEYHFEDSCCGKCPMGTTCYVDQMTGA